MRSACLKLVPAPCAPSPHGSTHPILVAELEGEVVGWASLSKWSDRCAYSEAAETFFYVKEEHRGKGIGRQLKEATIEEARTSAFTP